MFTEQIAQLIAALSGDLSPGGLQAMEQLIGSCSQTLTHRGQMNLPGLTLNPGGGDSSRPVFNEGANGVVRWARAVTDVYQEVNTRNGVSEWWVQAQDMDDRYGTGQRGPTFNVFVQETGASVPNVDKDDSVQYIWMPDDGLGGTWMRSLSPGTQASTFPNPTGCATRSIATIVNTSTSCPLRSCP